MLDVCHDLAKYSRHVRTVNFVDKQQNAAPRVNLRETLRLCGGLQENSINQLEPLTIRTWTPTLNEVLIRVRGVERCNED